MHELVLCADLRKKCCGRKLTTLNLTYSTASRGGGEGGGRTEKEGGNGELHCFSFYFKVIEQKVREELILTVL